MANNFDQFPLYDPIVKPTSNQLSSLWVGYFSQFYQTLTDYLTQGGVLLPPLSTEERDALQNIRGGQTIYNTTLDSAQYYKAGTGTWVSF